MKTAIVHDHLAQDGGAERVAQVLQEIFPQSPTYTLVYNKKNAHPEFADKKIHTSFIQKIPLGVSAYEWFITLMPSATEHFNLNSFDLIISSTSFSAKGVITPPNAIHICYCHTPTRFLWTDSHQYVEDLKHNFAIRKILPFVLPKLRLWDRIAAERVDHFIANSIEVQKRIKKYYNRTSTVIYPPVETQKYKIADQIDNYFLAGGRLVGYKRFDLLINAFNRLNMPLIIFGDGPQLNKLKKIAKPNIKFLGKISETKKIDLLGHCKAFLNPQIEDFGITAIEAMASGRPVIAYRAGGALETVREHETGEFFDEQTWEALADKIIRFNHRNYNSLEIKKHAEQFDKEIFIKNIQKFIKQKTESCPYQRKLEI